MNQKDQSELSEQELLDLAKQKKSTAIINAFLIGLLIGIVIYGVAKNNLGFFALIPIFIAFKIFNKPKNNKSQEE
jgi:hypothetical protein